jgi:glycosyltransferase involved in cell wall biosynthesis
MNVVFVHQAFPAQFGRLAFELQRRYGWKCRFLVEHLSSCPTPTREMLAELELRPLPAETDGPGPWSASFGKFLEQCGRVAHGVASLEGPIDLVVAHGGRGAPTLFLPDVVRGPVLSYCEYYFAHAGRDLSARIDLPPAEPAGFFPRCINAPALTVLAHGGRGYSPTAWQRASFPARFHEQIAVHFDGIDTELYRPQTVSAERLRHLLGGRSLAPGDQIVTYVARGLEAMRGFDLFVRLAERLAPLVPNVLFVVVGDTRSYYGWDNFHTGGVPFKDWAFRHAQVPLDRFAFLGHIQPTELADVLACSALHCYQSVPFVVSWSLFNALASGCVVLAADTDPVREVLTPAVTGLTAPLFDTDRWTELALQVLHRPADHADLARAARQRILDQYSLDVCIPRLRDYFSSQVG